MSPFVRNILGIIAGLAVALVVNMVLIMLGSSLVEGPEGFNANDMESYHLLELKHMVMPFLAHALGTLFGAMTTSFLAVRKMRSALVVGLIHMIGGIAMVIQTNAPVWFDVVDLTFAYLPMAVLGVALAKVFSKQ